MNKTLIELYTVFLLARLDHWVSNRILEDAAVRTHLTFTQEVKNKKTQL